MYNQDDPPSHPVTRDAMEVRTCLQAQEFDFKVLSLYHKSFTCGKATSVLPDLATVKTTQWI